MRVVLITDTIRMGGAERVFADLARAAVDAGHETILLAPQPYLVEELAAVVSGATVRRFGDDAFRTAPTIVARGRSLLAQVPALVRVMRELRPDVLHVSNGGHPGSGLC
nr:glycosyltransferase [Solirubrobacterales bacterium]